MADLRSTTTRALPGGYSFAVASVIFGPLFGPGYLLLRDAVSTPRSYLTDSALGLGDAAPRAVPQDAALAIASSIVDGGVVVKLILFAALWLSGWGAAVLVRSVLSGIAVGPQLVAATVVMWNPYVAERLLQGHWSLLVGYAALPWTAKAAIELRSGSGVGAWCALAVCLGAAGLTPTGGLLAALVAVVLVRPKHLVGVGGMALVASAPWLVAAVISGAGATTSDPAGVAAFAARAEPGLATIGSLAGLGGIWNSAAVPTSRTSGFAFVGTALLLGVVAIGLPYLWRRRQDRAVLALACTAIGALLFATVAATPLGISAGEWLVVEVPGAGLLRDTQKWIALAVPLYALAAAAGCQAIVARFAKPEQPNPARFLAPAASILLLLVALPDLVWGVGGALRPVRYPAAWERVAAAIDTELPGDVAVVPGGMFRAFPYTGRAPVLDPAPRMLPRDVLQTGQLIVSDGPAPGRVDGEGSRAAEVDQLLATGAPVTELAARGVGWILVERTAVGQAGRTDVSIDGLEQIYADDELALYRVPGVADEDEKPRGAALFAHAMWSALLAGGILGSLFYIVIRVRRRPDES